MIPHIKIFGSIIIVMTGMFSLLYTYQVYKIFPYRYLKTFAYYFLFSNLFQFLVLGLKYFQINIYDSSTTDVSPVLTNIFYLIVSGTFVGRTITMVQTVSNLLHGVLVPIVKKWIVPVVILGVLLVVIDILWFEEGMSLDPYQILLYTMVFVYYFEAPAQIFVLYKARSEQDKQYKKMLIAFALLFLLMHVLMPGLRYFPEPINQLGGRINFLYSNLIPIIWIKFFFLDYAKQEAKRKRYDSALAVIVEKFSISKRELEILKLILDGNSNREIKTKLFISYHTVKNHVYNIFQKLGVKSRYELMHFLQEQNA